MYKVVLLCAAVIGAASALDCYQCQGSGCDTDTKLWTKYTCGSNSGIPQYTGYQWGCLKQTYKDKISHKDMVERKCVSVQVDNGKAKYNCRTDLGEPYECPVCLTSLCNSAPKVNFSFAALSGVILVFLAKYAV